MTRKCVTVIGAGLSGLCCARELLKRGLDVLLIEGQDEVGGRVRTDRENGFLLDRGFQVLQTAYPEAAAQLDYRELRLHSFEPGARIRTQGRIVDMSDPWRRPSKILSTAFNGIGTFSDRLKLAKLRWHVTRSSLEDIWKGSDSTTQEYLRQTWGLSSDIVDRFFRPWFSGVFLEQNLETSSHFFQFLFRIFALGDAALPERGMGAIPQQLAATIPSSKIRLSTRVDSLAAGHRVNLIDGEKIESDAVVLAVSGPEAARLTNGRIQSPESRSTTCFYFAAPEAPFPEPILVLDGDKKGPVNNMCVVSNVAKSYAPAGQALISASVVGRSQFDSRDLESNVRRQLREWYGASVDRWSMLRRYDIHHALPSQPAHFRDGVVRPTRLADSVYYCGDYCETASIQGAMISGRRTAEAVSSDLLGDTPR
jgi:phytoene dehydrogenase-like protein